MFFVIAFIFFILFVRLLYIQVIQSKKLQMIASDQWTRDLPVTAKRGLILDRNNEVLADTKTMYTVYLRAKNVDDPEYVATNISKILELDYEATLKKCKNKSVSEITLKRKVSKEKVSEIINKDLKGVYFSEDILRVYPYEDMLATVLGYTSIDNNGQCGVEKVYNDFLKGIDGKKLTESDIRGVEIENSKGKYVSSIDGLNVKLTIDMGIQQIAENVIKSAYLTHTPKAARCIVMKPNTGEILAMVNLPSLDLNNLPRQDVNKLLALSKNELISSNYEPGSTFKIVTAAINMQEYKNGNKNAFSPEHIFNNGRTRTIDGQRIKCWSNHENGKHSNQKLSDALNNSCNPIFVDIAMSIGKDTFYSYLDKFGYGKVTGIDAIGEGKGILLNREKVKNCDLARIGFGQTIAVTPIQLICATASCINGGKLIKPYFLDSIYSKDNMLVSKNYPDIKDKVIDEDISKTLASYLEGVVREGSGKHAYIANYFVGGKTGTAQKYENGHIAQGKYISSFVGFFPSLKPEYIALVILDEPVGQHYGSIVAAPYAKKIFEEIIDLKNIKPFS